MIRLAAVLLVLLLALAASQAWAAPQCAPRDGALKMLAEKYGETLTKQAMTNGGALLEMTENPATGSWSALLSKPNGETCLILSGKGVETFAAVPPGIPS